jgi:hypothetical protein
VRPSTRSTRSIHLENADTGSRFIVANGVFFIPDARHAATSACFCSMLRIW